MKTNEISDAPEGYYVHHIPTDERGLAVLAAPGRILGVLLFADGEGPVVGDAVVTADERPIGRGDVVAPGLVVHVAIDDCSSDALHPPVLVVAVAASVSPGLRFGALKTKE